LQEERIGRNGSPIQEENESQFPCRFIDEMARTYTQKEKEQKNKRKASQKKHGLGDDSDKEMKRKHCKGSIRFGNSDLKGIEEI